MRFAGERTADKRLVRESSSLVGFHPNGQNSIEFISLANVQGHAVKCSVPMQRVLIRAAFGLLSALLFVAESRGIQPEVSLAVKLRHWDTDTGLPSPRVFALAYAPDGYVWVGTYGGLVRCDGIAFTTFTPENVPEISNASITALAVDAQGAIWIGTEGGQLITRTAECFRALPTPWAKPKRINVICPGADGGLWLGTRHGIVTVHGDEDRFFGEADGLEAMDVSHVAIDGAGRPWALCGGIVHVLKNDRWQAHRFGGIVDGRVSAIMSSVADGIWCAEMDAELASDGGSRILRVDANGRVERVAGGPWPRTASRSRIDVLLEDAVGRLWCATRGGGIYCREANSEWREVGEETGLARADAVALAADPSGSIWIGTRNTGAFQASPVKVQSFRMPPATSDHVVTSVRARKDGSLWAGTDGSSVIAFHGGTAKNFGLEEGLPSLDIVAVVEGPGRSFYAAMGRGLARLEQDRFTRVSLPEMSLTASCHCLFQDEQERLWAGTSDGVIWIHGTGLEPVPVENGRPLDAMGFTQDANGRLISLSRTGQIHAFRNGRFRHLFSATSDPISRMRSIAADAEGSLWLGSYGACLSCDTGETACRWTMQDNGVPSSHVLAIVAVALSLTSQRLTVMGWSTCAPDLPMWVAIATYDRSPAAVRPAGADPQHLTARQQEILEHLARGLLYKEIAETVGISYETVNNHIRQIYKKLHIRSRSQAVAKYFQERRGKHGG